MLLRLLTFRSGKVGELTDQFVRGSLRDGLGSQATLRYMFAGRGAPEPGSRRVVVTLWDEGGPSVRELAGLLPVEAEAQLLDAQVELYDAAVEHETGRWEEAQILRVYRGRAQPGVLERYLADVRRGTVDDVMQGHGPLGLFLAQTAVDEFLTVSIWSSWKDIESATGGNVRNPFATRHAYHLAGGEADHLEIVPGSTLAAPPREDDAQGAILPSPVAG